MGQVHVRVTLTHYREAILARLGQLQADHVHYYAIEALVNTNAMQCVIPPAVADRLGLLWLRRRVVGPGRHRPVGCGQPARRLSP